MPKAPENLREFAGLLKVVEFLRGPDGCPWDKEQTHQSLTRYAIEEAFELAEAIDTGEAKSVREELGDLLLQVVLHAEIARQDGQFDIFDVIQGISEKMVRRHPHVFADVKAETSQEVLKNWQEIKQAEKGKTANQPFTFDIPAGMPSLLRAQKIGEKTKKVAFDWENAAQCWHKVKEELGELEEVLNDSDSHEARFDNLIRERLEEELGDLLFSLAQLARHLSLDSEQSLRKTNRRFEERFARMQDIAKRAGWAWEDLSPLQKETFWKQAKKKE